MKRGQWIWYLLFLFVITGCQVNEGESTRIPPPYSETAKQKREADLLAYLTNCINKRIDTDENYYKRSVLYFEKGDYQLALEDINAAIRLRDNVGLYFLQRGLVNRELNHLEEAYKDAERAEALQQTSPQLYILFADILQEQQKYAQAETYMKGLLETLPFDGGVYYVRGMIELKNGDTIPAIQDFEQAISLNPKLLRAYGQASVLHNKVGNHQRSDSLSERALHFFPNNLDLLNKKIAILESRAEWDSTLVYLDRVQKLEPNGLSVRVRIAETKVKARRYNEALAEFILIKEQNPTYPEVTFWIGFCHEKQWRVNTAKSFYEEELRINPGSYNARNGIWRINNMANKSEEIEGSSEEAPPSKTLDDISFPTGPLTPRSVE